MKKQHTTYVAIIVTVIIFGGLVAATVNRDDGQDPVPTSQTIITTNNTQDSNSQSTTASLLVYLIEEEKLAHDVYSAMYQKWGAQVFGNILQSENSHQGQVLTLLSARNLADPRSTEVGDFQNQELQKLYDQLIVQGNQSAQDAYKVGVIIEEKDIADISVQLSTATEQDVIDTLTILRNGSENHLRAFNRQLSR